LLLLLLLLLTNAKVDLLVDRSEEEEEERKRMSVTSDDVNLLVYRYLVESGFVHTAFSFAAESALAKTSVAASDVPQVRSAAARGLFASSRPHAAALFVCARDRRALSSPSCRRDCSTPKSKLTSPT
jgi:hypothetical protein